MQNAEKEEWNVYEDSEADGVSLYMREVCAIPLLTPAEERDLAEQKDLGDEEARIRLIEANLRLVISVAKQYRNRGIEFPDLINQGNIGLMKAVDKYDYRLGNRFSTYAVWWVKQEVLRLIDDQSRTIRFPVHVSEKNNTIRRVQRDLRQVLEREPTRKEIAEETGISEETVADILALPQNILSLDQKIGEKDDTTFADFIRDEKNPDVTELAAAALLKEDIAELLETLTVRERRVVILRFGLNGERERTLAEIGREFGVSRERVRQIEKSAMHKLQRPACRRKLAGYMD